MCHRYGSQERFLFVYMSYMNTQQQCESIPSPRGVFLPRKSAYISTQRFALLSKSFPQNDTCDFKTPSKSTRPSVFTGSLDFNSELAQHGYIIIRYFQMVLTIWEWTEINCSTYTLHQPCIIMYGHNFPSLGTYIWPPHQQTLGGLSSTSTVLYRDP